MLINKIQGRNKSKKLKGEALTYLIQIKTLVFSYFLTEQKEDC